MHGAAKVPAKRGLRRGDERAGREQRRGLATHLDRLRQSADARADERRLDAEKVRQRPLLPRMLHHEFRGRRLGQREKEDRIPLQGKLPKFAFRTEGGLMLACAGGQPGRAALSLRPERLEIGPEPLAGLDNDLPGTVEFVSYLGAQIDIHVRLSPADRLVVQTANRAGGFAPEVGQTVHVGWQASAGQVFAD